MTNTPPSDRTRVKRLAERGAYDRDTILSILDEGLVCHVGIAVEGQPFVIPMTYARSGERLIVHGSGGSRTLKALKAGADVCVTVTHVDALVLARSAFHHSMNYRSVVIFARARAVDDETEKRAAFREYFERLIPGRWDDVREPDTKELAQTVLLEIPFDEASAKIRTGPPVDDEADYALPVWAGLLPFTFTAGAPEADERSDARLGPPGYLLGYGKKRRG